MVLMITVSRGCMRQLTIMGWVSHAAGILSVVIAVATDHWLRRVSDGYHVGIFPCCPTFKCGKTVVSRTDNSIEAFTDLIIVGMLLVGFGWILSMTHFCVTWRNDKRTLYGMSYLASGLVTIGGLTLVAGAVEFVAIIPRNMEDALRQRCQVQDNRIDTGFSYSLFVAGAVAFILAGVLLFLASCKQSNSVLPNRNGSRISIAVSERSIETPPESVTAHLTPQRRLSPLPHIISFDNPAFNTTTNEDHTDELLRSSRAMHRVTSISHSKDTHEAFQQLACPPSYESLSEFFSPRIVDTEAEESGQSTTAGYNFQSGSSASLTQPPPYDDSFKEEPPPYPDPN